MPAKKQERLRQTIKELEDSIAYIDRKQNFFDEVLPESVRMSATLSAPKMTEKSLRQFAAIKRSPGKVKYFSR